MNDAQKKILVAEDESSIATALKLKLEHEGYTVEVVRNGNEALKKINEMSFSLVLLDIMMPEKDGFDVLKELQNSGKKMKVAITSNLGQPEDKERAKSLGAVDFLVKSDTSLIEIIDRVNQLIK